MKRWVAVAVVGLAVTGCAPKALNNLSNIGKESDPTRFYTLTAIAEKPADGKPAMPGLVLGIGPVSVADYLDRSHIVVRKSTNQLELEDFDRWAGSPAKEIQRVLGADLALLLGTERVVGYPWKSAIVPDKTVEVAVERFEYDAADGKVWLVASWQVFGDNGRQVEAFRRSTLSMDANAGYEEISAALGALTGELAVQIAQAVRAK